MMLLDCPDSSHLHRPWPSGGLVVSLVAARFAIADACAAAETTGQLCGLSPTDWCRSPPGDPCGKRSNERSCRDDPRCVGLPYRGESVVACLPDRQGLDQLPGCWMHQPLVERCSDALTPIPVISDFDIWRATDRVGTLSPWGHSGCRSRECAERRSCTGSSTGWTLIERVKPPHFCLS